VRSRSSLQRAMEMSVPPAARHEDMPQQQAVEMGCLPAARHGDGAPAASGGDGRPPGGAPWRPAPAASGGDGLPPGGAPWRRGPCSQRWRWAASRWRAMETGPLQHSMGARPFRRCPWRRSSATPYGGAAPPDLPSSSSPPDT
jgi:hypothetical protein